MQQLVAAPRSPYCFKASGCGLATLEHVFAECAAMLLDGVDRVEAQQDEAVPEQRLKVKA